MFDDDAVLASAALDRLLYRSTVNNIRDESFRLKDDGRRVVLSIVSAVG